MKPSPGLRYVPLLTEPASSRESAAGAGFRAWGAEEEVEVEERLEELDCPGAACWAQLAGANSTAVTGMSSTKSSREYIVLRQRASRRLAASGFVVRGIEYDATVAPFTVALGAQVSLIAQRQVNHAPFA